MPSAAELPVRSTWFEVTELPQGVSRITEPAVNPFLRANVWHVRGRDRDLVVDTGMGIAPLRAAFPHLFAREPVVFITHGHYDHTGGAHEFANRWCHRAEAAELSQPEPGTLVAAEFGPSFAAALAADSPSGTAPEFLVDAVPRPGYDISDYEVRPAPATTLVDDGDRIDLGDRTLTVLHLPGHTPGSAGLFDADSGVLFTGDVLYEGELLDELPESNIDDYVDSMRRLSALRPSVVHAGHEDSFGPERMSQLCAAYLASRA